MNEARRCSLLLAFIVGGSVRAQSPASPAAYRPNKTITGTIRVWGSAQMADLMQRWQRGFSRYQPGVSFENHLNGAVSAIAGVYTGVADVALSREIWPIETMAFEQVLGYKPTAVEVATGSFDVPTKSDSLEIFVHKDNPISRLTLTQADAIFGLEHLRGAKNIRVWGDLGLRGAWADKPIHGYGFRFENAAAMFFSDVVLKGSGRWNCNVKGFRNETAADGTRLDAGRLILEALSKDRYGIAISNVHYARSEVKAVSLGAADGGPFVAPTKENILNRTYPLTRVVYAFLNRAPGKPVGPKVEDFLRYILSREGQRDVISEGAYLPLPAQIVAEQLKRIE
jgi:phosphate transport system substrate-binding protein